MLRIVHLSDFHLNRNSIVDMKEFLLKALKKDLKSFNEEKKIDLIVFSGDLVDKGGESFENNIQTAFREFEESVIYPIIKEIDLPKEHFFITPGNHDVKRDADDYINEIGLSNLLNSTEAVNSFIDSENLTGVKRILSFKEFEKMFYIDFKGEHIHTNYQSSFKIESDGLCIGITCFNSAWRCFDSRNDKGKILLGERQVINARRIIKDCNIKIAIIHHPIDYLSCFDLNSVTSFIEKDYDMIFCGHNHEGTHWVKTGLYGKLFVSICPSNWAYNLRNNDRFLGNGYSIIDYDWPNKNVICHSRRYSHRKECFDPNTDIGDEFGRKSFLLSDVESLRKFNKELQVTEIIKNMHFERINEHLLSYNTDTKAPKDIDEIFVFPHMVRKIEYDIKDVDEKKVFNLEELYVSDENILIFGTKESGKTILLDKILIGLTNNINKYHKTAVFFDFNDVENRRFETIINNFIGIGIRSIEGFLENHIVVLLIDNLEFNKFKSNNLKRLEDFVNRYKNVRVVATCNLLVEDEIPIEAYQNSFIYKFNLIFIRNFRTKQTKELMQKWFSKNNFCYSHEKINNLVEIFKSLELPWTPMAISIFLWIIEQQDDYKPVNNATMLENFIERLFRKWSKNEIFSENFDYRNKERLLAEISYEMYLKDSLNYSMSYSELLDFIINYLDRKKFDFSGEDLLNHFLSKGILIKEYNNGLFVRFRFNCFFQYFLTKRMMFDSEFKKSALRKENILKFADEIDYLTGLQRDQSDILRSIIEFMESEFSEAIKLFVNEFDNTFDIKKSLASKLSDKNIIDSLKKNGKPNDEYFEKKYDDLIDSLNPHTGIEKKEEIQNPLERLDALLVLSTKVFKNTEECEESDLKSSAYKKILICAMAFSCIMYHSIENILESHFTKTDLSELRSLLIESRKLIPLATQKLLNSIMGTSKLSIVIREKIESDLKNKSISDFEKFISVFLYSDINGKDNLNYIKKFVRGINRQYIYDITLSCIISKYYFQSNDKYTDNEYENLIAEIITHSKGMMKLMKSKIMIEFRDKKKKYISKHSNNEDNVLKL